MSDELLSHGSLVLVFVWLMIGSLGIPLPEDIALLAAGVMLSQGTADLPLTILVVTVGVLGGDMVLFLAARRLGPRAYQKRLFQRLLPPKRRARFEDLYAKHGGKVVFIARHVAGLRAATFVLAGIHQMAVRRFIFWDALGACITVPVIVGLGYLGAHHIDVVRAGIAHVQHYIVLVVVVLLAGYLVYRQVRKKPPPDLV